MSTQEDSKSLDISKIAYVPIDIGKNVNAFCVYGASLEKPVVKPTLVHTTQSGLAEICAQIDLLLADSALEEIRIGFEPTGIYHEAWVYALRERYAQAIQMGRISISSIAPYRTKQARKKHQGRPRKSDFIDLRAIADCLRDTDRSQVYLPDVRATRLRLWVYEYEQLRRAHFGHQHRILTHVDRLWPSAFADVKQFEKAHPGLTPPEPLVSTKVLERKIVRALTDIGNGLNPHVFASMDVDALRAQVRQHMGRCGENDAKRVILLAQNAVLQPAEICALLAEQVKAEFDAFRVSEQRLFDLEAQAESLIQSLPCKIVPSIDGVSTVLAARYYGHIGDIARFARPSRIWAFAGFDSVRESSGDSVRVGKITKRGPAGLRDTLYQIGFHVSQCCPPAIRAYERALATNGGKKVAATLHVAHKVNRLIWCMLNTQQPYDPAKWR